MAGLRARRRQAGEKGARGAPEAPHLKRRIRVVGQLRLVVLGRVVFIAVAAAVAWQRRGRVRGGRAAGAQPGQERVELRIAFRLGRGWGTVLT